MGAAEGDRGRESRGRPALWRGSRGGASPWPPWAAVAGPPPGWQCRMPHWWGRSRLASSALAILGGAVAVGRIDEGLAALVAVSPAAPRGVPVDSALGMPGGVLAAVGFLPLEAAAHLVPSRLGFGFRTGGGHCGLGGGLGVKVGLLETK